MSNLVNHAKRELELADLFDKDSDYDGAIGPAVMELVQVFASQGHSGFSAGWVRDLFGKLSNFKSLTPITSNPAEWMQHAPDVWQNLRQSSCFSKDGGKSFYDIDEEGRPERPCAAPSPRDEEKGEAR